MIRHLMFAGFLLSAVLGGCQESPSTRLDLQWEGIPDRPWPAPELWANRLQDWEVRDGRLTVRSSLPMRTAHILTRRSAPEKGEIVVTLRMGLSDVPDGGAEGMRADGLLGAAGFLVGAGGADLDYRRTALIHHSPGPGGGLFLGVDEEGHLVAANFSEENRILARSDAALPTTDSLELRIRVGKGDGGSQMDREGGTFTLTLQGRSLSSHDSPVTLKLPGVAGHQLAGGMALVSHG